MQEVQDDAWYIEKVCSLIHPFSHLTLYYSLIFYQLLQYCPSDQITCNSDEVFENDLTF